jgi:hypothetical protein
MGLLDSVAYGLAGGVAGGADAAGRALEDLQKQNLQMELNQQTSDLSVAADKQKMDYALAQKHGEQARVAAIITGDPSAGAAVGSSPSQASGAPPSLSAGATPVPSAPADTGAAPAPAAPPTAAPNAASPTPSGPASAPAVAAPNAASPTPPGSAAGGPPAAASAPAVAAPNAAGQPPAGEDDDLVSGAQQRLLKAGMVDEADKVGKMSQYKVAGSAWGKQILYNESTGKYKVLDETGQRREASAEEIAQMRAEARNQGFAAGNAAHEAAAQKSYADILDKAPVPGAAARWGDKDPVTGKMTAPHPDVIDAYHTLSGTIFQQSHDPIGAVTQARQLTNQVADQAEAVATKQGLKPGTPEFAAARDAAFRRGIAAGLAGKKAATQTQKPATPSQPATPGLISSAQDDTTQATQ